MRYALNVLVAGLALTVSLLLVAAGLFATDTSGGAQTPDLAPDAYACVIVADFLRVDETRDLATTFAGLSDTSCQTEAARQAREGFRRFEQEKTFYYPAHRVLRLEVRPARAGEER